MKVHQATFIASTLSGIALLACMVVILMIYKDVQNIWRQLDIEISSFKGRTDDLWQDMMRLGRNQRSRRHNYWQSSSQDAEPESAGYGGEGTSGYGGTFGGYSGTDDNGYPSRKFKGKHYRKTGRSVSKFSEEERKKAGEGSKGSSDGGGKEKLFESGDHDYEEHSRLPSGQSHAAGDEIESAPPSIPDPQDLLESIDARGCQCRINNNCPAGPPGPKGKPGHKGEDGHPGADGKPGSAAVNIEQTKSSVGCFHCPQGLQGPPGALGRPGPRGMAGAKGQAGMPGRDGNPGRPGEPGPPGVPGPRGPIGPPGEKGEDAEHPVGRRGAKGATGPAGRQGPQGVSGRDAPPGPQGPVGPPGHPGPQGIQGSDGVQGEEGPPGRPGKDSEYCPCPDRKETITSAESEDDLYSKKRI